VKEKLQVVIFDSSEFCSECRLKFINTSIESRYFYEFV